VWEPAKCARSIGRNDSESGIGVQSGLVKFRFGEFWFQLRFGAPCVGKQPERLGNSGSFGWKLALSTCGFLEWNERTSEINNLGRVGLYPFLCGPDSLPGPLLICL
jgi:hypothetical protein